ncbi:vWA domain-containing protein [Adhaeretor mobilis]|uniref:von Willebrand factor type A domain protein n=1 Tax=Adhaeretor mobilis TaxID=1930276 RepID=A0A517MSB5_9BACT|nr:VWA domain-containing protein [Adhaeretor mobilis]QDS97771.1 von Willebrand factor type A domain protein [Adhaeretor mobilis]
MPNQLISRRQDCSSPRGAIMPLIAIMLPILLILSSFAVNLAYMELTRTELRIASDAATRAAGYTLNATGDESDARFVAREASTRNLVAGEATVLKNGDIVFGTATRSGVGSRYNFTTGGSKSNAVQVLARRDSGSGTGAVKMLLPGFGAVTEFEPNQLAISSQVELDIALVLDRSGSMAYGDYEDSAYRASQYLGPEVAPEGWWFGDAAPAQSRWRGLVSGVHVFLDMMDQSPQIEHLSLTTYATSATRESELGSDYASIASALDGYSNNLEAGGTNVGDGIYEAINALSAAAHNRPWAVKVIVLMSDGQHNLGTDPVYAAQDAADQGITVYTVTFSQEADQGRMQTVASEGSGLHFHAETDADLRDAFREIAKSLPTLLVQ